MLTTAGSSVGFKISSGKKGPEHRADGEDGKGDNQDHIGSSLVLWTKRIEAHCSSDLRARLSVSVAQGEISNGEGVPRRPD